MAALARNLNLTQRRRQISELGRQKDHSILARFSTMPNQAILSITYAIFVSLSFDTLPDNMSSILSMTTTQVMNSGGRFPSRIWARVAMHIWMHSRSNKATRAESEASKTLVLKLQRL